MTGEATKEHKTMVELPESEAQLFFMFRQYQKPFKFMVEKGVFKPNVVKAYLYFNKFNMLTAIDVTKREIMNSLSPAFVDKNF